jgi:cyclic pyranopterin phosphate synthase
MVDVGDKEVTVRRARASGRVRMRPETLRLVQDRQIAKGDVFEVARLAAIQAAKRTSELIPLCHMVPLDAVSVRFECLDAGTVAVEAEARATGRTGVEMEALVAVSVAALTVYDMCKSVDRAILVDQVRLEEKMGGKSGHYLRQR